MSVAYSRYGDKRNVGFLEIEFTCEVISESFKGDNLVRFNILVIFG